MDGGVWTHSTWEVSGQATPHVDTASIGLCSAPASRVTAIVPSGAGCEMTLEELDRQGQARRTSPSPGGLARTACEITRDPAGPSELNSQTDSLLPQTTGTGPRTDGLAAEARNDLRIGR